MNIKIENKLNVIIPEAFLVNGNQIRLEEYFKFLDDYSPEVFKRKPLQEGQDDWEIKLKIFQGFNFGEFSYQDFLKIKEIVLGNLDMIGVSLHNREIDHNVLLFENKLTFVGKWNEMDKMMKAIHKLAPMEERVDIQSLLSDFQGLQTIRF